MATPSFQNLIVDSFAGGGGASSGIARALGRSPDIAINHDATAIAVHRINHPTARHYTEDIWQVKPREACGGRPVGLMWLSPDCTHFSRAKGGKPVSKHIRGLAWVAVRWADAVGPDVFCMENVPEFLTWGPVGPDGQPCSRRKGLTFKQFTGRLRNLGYQLEWRTLRACDFGAPTSRTRLFLVARRDGQMPRWPQPVFGPARSRPWRTAAECIDWSIPCPSIFDRQRSLAENTLKRIAAGIRRFVLEASQPFIVPLHGTSPSHTSTHSVHDPLSTVCAGGMHHGLITPMLINLTHGGRPEDICEPFKTITGAHRGEKALVAPTLIQMGYGEREGQAPRVLDLHAPLGTVVSGGRKHGLVAAYLARHFTGIEGRELNQPVPTITAIDHNSLVTAQLGSITDRREQVRAFLVAYYGNERDGQSLHDPMRTVTAKERLGLVTVHGLDYAIVDIGMRMLQPRELFNAQGFDADYEIEHGINDEGDIVPISKTAQVRLCGNSVCPDLSDAIVRAQFGGDYERDLFSGAAA